MGAKVGGARLDLQLGLLVVGDGDDRARLDAAVAVQVAQPLGEHPRLAGAGGRDHARRPGPVGHCGELIGGQVGARIDRLGSRDEATAVDGLAVNDGEPAHVAGCPWLPRATVDPDRCAVAKGESAGPAGVAAAASSSRAAFAPHHQTGSPARAS